MDVTGTERLWGKAKDAAYRFKQDMKAGLSLPGTVGVAGNKLVSSIASQVIPSEGVLDVDHGREASFMAPLRVGVIPGIGRFRRKILLEELSITRVRELAALNMGSLKILFGRQAYVIHQRALGIDPTPVYPTLVQPMVSEEITLPLDDNDDQRLLGVLYRLVEKCAHRLRERALFPQKSGLLIRYSDQMERKGQIKLSRLSFWDFELYHPLETLFFRLCDRRVRIRFIKVWFWDFSARSGQLSLFHQPSSDQGKNARIIPCLDRVREKHGEEAIRYGRTASYHHRDTQRARRREKFFVCREIPTNKKISFVVPVKARDELWK
jgi:DNA polymerase-4